MWYSSKNVNFTALMASKFVLVSRSFKSKKLSSTGATKLNSQQWTVVETENKTRLMSLLTNQQYILSRLCFTSLWLVENLVCPQDGHLS